MRNGTYVADNRDRFAFGETEVLPHEQVVEIVQGLFSVSLIISELCEDDT